MTKLEEGQRYEGIAGTLEIVRILKDKVCLIKNGDVLCVKDSDSVIDLIEWEGEEYELVEGE